MSCSQNHYAIIVHTKCDVAPGQETFEICSRSAFVVVFGGNKTLVKALLYVDFAFVFSYIVSCNSTPWLQCTWLNQADWSRAKVSLYLLCSLPTEQPW